MNSRISRRILSYGGMGVLLVAAVFIPACQTLTGARSVTTPAPTATRALATPSETLRAGISPTAIPQFDDAGVRYCYYVPGVSVPAQMPSEVLATATQSALATPAPLVTASVDPATTQKQLDQFEQIWQDVDWNYVYTDFNGHDWKAIGDKYRALIRQGLSQETFYLAMSQMVSELDDDHSGYESPALAKAEDEAIAGQQSFVGIGARVLRLDAQGSSGVIVSVFPGSPAAEAGLRLHDKVVAVDGGPLLDKTTGQPRTTGPEGTKVTITFQRPGQHPQDITLTRRAISGAITVDYCIIPGTRIGYIYFPTFEDDTIDEQTGDALRKMSVDGPLEGLILDNRMNLGGLNRVAESILSFFTTGPNGQYVSRAGSIPLDIRGQDINGSQSVPLIVLVDLNTASMGEIFSGILQVSRRATIIGQNTLGNVETTTPFDFSDGSRLRIAMRTFEPVGEANGIWERTGIVPDISAPTRWDLFTEANDPALAKAVAVLQGNP
jgi:carboxyl-terminal processing protease